MKLLFSIFLLIFSARAQASLKFTYSETKEFAKPNLIDILEVQTELEAHGYWPLDSSHEQKLQGIGVDQIFFDSTTNRFVLLKFGLKVSDSANLGKIIEVEGDFVFHGEVGNKIPYALYFTKHSSQEVASVVQRFGLKTSVSFLNILIPAAHANSCSKTFMAAVVSLTTTSVAGLQQLGKCLLSADEASQESIKSMEKVAISALKAAFTTNPLDYWAKVKAASNQLTRALKQIKNDVAALAKEVGGMDTETQFQIGCSLVGAASPMIAAAVLSGGAALTTARLTAIFANQLRKVRQLVPALRAISLQRRVRGFKAADDTIDMVVSCAR